MSREGAPGFIRRIVVRVAVVCRCFYRGAFRFSGLLNRFQLSKLHRNRCRCPRFPLRRHKPTPVDSGRVCGVVSAVRLARVKKFSRSDSLTPIATFLAEIVQFCNPCKCWNRMQFQLKTTTRRFDERRHIIFVVHRLRVFNLFCFRLISKVYYNVLVISR